MISLKRQFIIVQDFFKSRFLAFCLGLLTCYVTGTAWFFFLYLSHGSPLSLGVVLARCVVPYLLPDLGKLLLAWLVCRWWKKRKKYPQEMDLMEGHEFEYFCADLLREYAYRLDISGDFRVAEEQETQLLQLQILDKLLTDAYETADDDFITFIDSP